ncbi:EGF-like domain, extracellular [Phytophthora cactorum]|nr:EGF-like domain, extracellular [Phytophthora cactorum]
MAGRHHCVLLVTLTLCCCFLTEIQGACPSKCNRHGTCRSDNTCTCFPGYTGYDCNSRVCPKGAPWVDFATGQDSVRSVAQECSNRGLCNRGNGKCECDAGFAGPACQRLQVCRINCNGHGKCMSMRVMAATKNDYNLIYSATYDTPWDADRIYGCVCDHGYTGADCSLRQCPYGDDPISTGQGDEVQSVSCLCNGCTGTFTLSFRGETTRPLVGNVDTAATLKTALEDLITIRGVSVTLNGGTTLCDSDGVSAMITFTGTRSLTVETDGTHAAYGPTPPLTVRGTKEWLECSGRGTCNTLIGLCACATGFGPSNDARAHRSTGACATTDTEATIARSRNAPLDVLSCPTSNEAVCNNRGTCRTLRELAALTPTATFTTAGFVYGSDPNALSTWDADMAQGCYCDKVPLDRGKNVRYSGYSCAKTSTAAVKAALERLLTITSVSVSFATNANACSSAGNVMAVTFYSPSGDLPLLSISATALTHSTATVATNVIQTTQGTKEDVICNNRGRCDEDTGTCVCSQFHTSSNALGDFGAISGLAPRRLNAAAHDQAPRGLAPGAFSVSERAVHRRRVGRRGCGGIVRGRACCGPGGRPVRWWAALRGLPRVAARRCACAPFRRCDAGLQALPAAAKSDDCGGAELLTQQLEQRPKGTAVITVSNHSATVDDPAVLAKVAVCSMMPWKYMWPRNGRWSLASQEYCYTKGKLLSTLFFGAKTLPVKRGAGVDHQMIQAIFDKVEEGAWVHIFPEGKIVQHEGEVVLGIGARWRSSPRREKIGRLKWGVGKLIARATTRPIVVPVYHYNMEKLMPQDEKNRLISLIPKTNLDLGVIVGEPLSFDDLFERYADDRMAGGSPWETQEREKALYSAITRRIENALLALEKKTHRLQQ